MGKEGSQYHDYYFNRYENINKRGKKEEWEKVNTVLFDTYQFKTIIENLVDETDILTKFPQYDLVRDDIVEMISALFYTHFEMAKDLLQYDDIFEPTDFAENFVDAVVLERTNSQRDFSDYFYKRYESLNTIINEKNLKEGEKHDAKQDICKCLSAKKTTKSLLRRYRTIERSDYNYFVFKEYIRKENESRMIFYRQAYSGLIPYLMFKNNERLSAYLKHMLYNPIPSDDIHDYNNKKGYIKNLYIELSEKDINKAYKNDNTAEHLLQWYNELFDYNNKHYLKLSGENKVLEQQLLDIYFGCSAIGYILKNCTCDNASYVIEDVGFMGIFGICDGSKKVINYVIDEYSKDEDNYCTTPYEDADNQSLLLFEDIMNIFVKLMTSFVRYLNIKGSFDKRIQYVSNKNAVFVPPKLSDDWKYIFAKNTTKFREKYGHETVSIGNISINELINKYACNIPSSFRNTYFFEENMKNINAFL